MKIDRKGILIALGGVAMIAALVWAFAPRPVQVETAAAERAKFEEGVEEDGRTRLKDRYTISAPVTGRLARIALREGDKVEANAPVAVLAPVVSPMHDERTLLEAQARLKGADAGVSLAGARVEQARVSVEEARLELQRTEKLAREGFMAGAKLDSARLALSAAQRELEAAQAQRNVAVHERAQAAAALEPATGSRSGKPLSVRSPVSGTVLKIHVTSEGTVAAGTPLLDVGDPAHMEIIAQLLTTDAVQAAPGTRTMIERWGGPPVEGRVRLVEPNAFTKVSALGIEEQRVNVVIDIASPPKAWATMGDGFRVTARVITLAVDGATVVPVGAVFPHADGGMAVYVFDGGRARLKPVDIGGRNGEVAWVRTGVQPGDPVIIYPPPGVTDGARVALRKP